MFARVTTFQGSADRFDELTRLISEQIGPTVQQMGGNQGGYLLVDRKSGRCMTITLWDSEQALQASGQRIGSARTQMAQLIGATEPISQEYEVALQPNQA